MPRWKTYFETRFGQRFTRSKKALSESTTHLLKTRAILGKRNKETVDAQIDSKRAQAYLHSAKWKWLALQHRLESNAKRIQEIGTEMQTRDRNFKTARNAQERITREQHPEILRLREEIEDLENEVQNLNLSSADALRDRYISNLEYIKEQIKAAEMNIDLAKKHIELHELARGPTGKIKAHKVAIREDSERINELKQKLSEME
jgi:hypothetical protein